MQMLGVKYCSIEEIKHKKWVQRRRQFKFVIYKGGAIWPYPSFLYD